MFSYMNINVSFLLQLVWSFAYNMAMDWLDYYFFCSLVMYYYWLRGQGYKKTEELLQNQLKMVCFYYTPGLEKKRGV
jgi:hypothetical protein